jgi:molybdopterin molybdotransferase
MTGAPVPHGADCVIMIEHTEPVGEHEIRFRGERTADYICRKGEDIRAGQRVLERGTRIGAQHMAVLASVGRVRPLVAKRPSVAVVAGGDELVRPSLKPGPSQIRDSNTSGLLAQVEAAGAVACEKGLVRDVAADIDHVLKAALAEHDVVIVSGGVSVGEFDLVPRILRQNNVRLAFESIAVRPGKPTLFGIGERGYCFGLPGNPVSTFVVFELLVKPFLYRLMGHDFRPPCIRMPLSETVTRKDTQRQEWIPVNLTCDGAVRPVEYHGSAHILAMCRADALISVEVGVARVEKGTLVPVRLI